MPNYSGILRQGALRRWREYMNGKSVAYSQDSQQHFTYPFMAEKEILMDYYKTIFENTGTAMGTFGEDHIIQSVNHSFEELRIQQKRSRTTTPLV